MKKYHIKSMLIVIIPLFILVLVAFIFSHKDKNYNVSFIVNGINFWQYKNNGWKYLSTSDKIDWQKYDVYTSNEYINNYYVTISNDKTYFFDSNDDSYDVDSPYIAISSDSNIRILRFDEEEINNNDVSVINSYLNNNKIEYNGEYSTRKKFVTDINNDNNEDYIYILSNELYTENNIFYLVFAKCNNKLMTINNQIDKDSFVHYELAWVLSMKHNGFNNIILTEPREYDARYYLFSYNTDNNNYNDVFKN